MRSFRENSDTRNGGGRRGGGGQPGSHRALGLDPGATPQFTTTPGQVAFTPDGSQLVVTTKGNGNDIDVFGVGSAGACPPTQP